MNWNDQYFWKKKGSYKSFDPYPQSKLANAMPAQELSKRVLKDGIKVYCLDPGMIDSEFWKSQKKKGTIGDFLLKQFE